MILTEDLMYDIELKLNKLASNRHQSISKEDKIITLNNAQIQLIKQKLNLNNIYKLGIDSFNKRYDDLQVLIKSDVKLLGVNSGNKYMVPISEDYMFFVKAYVLADRGNCKGRALDVNLIPHADVQEWLTNSNLSPSFDYQETFTTLSDDKLEIYFTDFDLTECYLTYIKYPIKIDYPGYIHFDGTDSVLSNCELPEYLRDELVDLAVQELAMSTENVPAIESSNLRIQNNE